MFIVRELPRQPDNFLNKREFHGITINKRDKIFNLFNTKRSKELKINLIYKFVVIMVSVLFVSIYK